MSKKKKKTASRLVPSKVDQPVAQAVKVPTPAASRPIASSASTIRAQQIARAQQAARTQRQGLVTDYRYVLSDLKRIGILATAMFAIIIILSFVIH